MQELSADGLSSLCRLCGEVGECFDLFDDQEQGAEILDKIQRSIGIAIKESDGLPNGICNGCHEKLLNFCCFFDQCHDTQERLQEFISIQSAIKYEACDEDEIDSQAVGDEDCGDDQDNNYFFVEIEGDEAPDYCTEPEAETQSATKTATEVMEVEEEHDLSDAQFFTVPAEDNAETCERLPAINKNEQEEDSRCEPSTTRVLNQLPSLQLYDHLRNGEQTPSKSLNHEISVGIPTFEDSGKDCSEYRKEMDVLLCGDTDSQQTVSQLSCCSESRSLTSPSFSIQGEDYGLDQGGHIPITEFPLQDAHLTAFKTGPDIESRDGSAFTSVPHKTVDALDNFCFPNIQSGTSQLQSSFEEAALASEIEKSLVGQASPPQQEKLIVDPEFPSQTQNLSQDDLESLPSLPSPSVTGQSAGDVNTQQGQSEAATVLSVDAKVVGATGEIKFQRNLVGGVKIIFPPTTAEKAIKFDDLINLFSLQEVRQAFCAENKEEDIIQQLVQQGLGSSGVPVSGRTSSMSHTSSLDLPNSLLSPLSVSDSWSWEISQLLSGDENSNQGDEGDNRSELNTPIVTLPPKLSDEETSAKYVPLPSPSPSFVKHFNIPSIFQTSVSTSGNFPASETSSCVNLPQRIFTPLQVQIPEEGDTPVRMSRTLHSCNTYFEEISLGISPVLDLDPNVATIRMSCPPMESSQLSLFKKGTDNFQTIQAIDQIQSATINTSSNDMNVSSVPKDDESDIKEVAVDIIIDDGKMNWLKLLPDPTNEFIKKISRRCFKCHICSKSFKFKFQVQRHIKISHSTAKPFICAICGSTFSVKYYLTRHMKLHDSSNKFQCSLCDRKFTRHYELTEHEESHRNPSSLKCTNCGKQVNSKSALNVHMSICTGSLQAYVCDICGKSYAGLTALNHHRVRHESLKAFKCTMCESSFHTQWQLVNHTKRHATKGLYVCKFCSLAFNSTSNLKKHVAKCPALTVNKVVKKA